MKHSVVRFNATALAETIKKRLVQEQTDRFIAYAKETIMEIGNKIQSYNSANHMDRTGNLLNSLCWGVAYNNELKDSGFYREANSLSLSYLHERYEEHVAYPVDGRARAESYIKQYGSLGSGGGTWRVWFAVLAPYWGYWEQGFTMRSGGGRSGIPRSSRHLQFSVMSQFYDIVSKELSPAKMKFKVYVEHYSATSMHRDWKSRVDNPYSHFNRKWMQDSRYRKG